MKRIDIKEDITIDWYLDYNVCALNTKTFVYENTNDFCKDDNTVIYLTENYLTDDIDEFYVSNFIQELNDYGANVIYALYTKNTHYLVGCVTQNN